MLLGPVWKAISPSRTINAVLARVSGSDPEVGMYTYPERLGYWPAAVGLFAFVWLELVYPHSTEVGPVRLWCAVYIGVMLIGGALFGNRFFERADPFEVYSSLVAKLSVWGHRDGRLVLRSPLANLDTVPVAPGLVGGRGGALRQHGVRLLQGGQPVAAVRADDDDPLRPHRQPRAAGLLRRRRGGLRGRRAWRPGSAPGTRRSTLPDLFAHSVVPIIVGYIVAHYLTYLVEYGQTTLVQLSDPFSRGDDYLGTADLAVNYWLSFHPDFLARLKVGAVVVGHVLGVIAAHDRAVALLPRRHQLTGSSRCSLAMVFFTVGGLYLLFAA